MLILSKMNLEDESNIYKNMCKELKVVVKNSPQESAESVKRMDGREFRCEISIFTRADFLHGGSESFKRNIIEKPRQTFLMGSMLVSTFNNQRNA